MHINRPDLITLKDEAQRDRNHCYDCVGCRKDRRERRMDEERHRGQKEGRNIEDKEYTKG